MDVKQYKKIFINKYNQCINILSTIKLDDNILINNNYLLNENKLIRELEMLANDNTNLINDIMDIIKKRKNRGFR